MPLSCLDTHTISDIVDSTIYGTEVFRKVEATCIHVYRVKIQVEVQSAMTTNYIDAAVYMFCISGHG